MVKVKWFWIWEYCAEWLGAELQDVQICWLLAPSDDWGSGGVPRVSDWGNSVCAWEWASVFVISVNFNSNCKESKWFCKWIKQAYCCLQDVLANGMELNFPIAGGWRELYMKSCQNKERKTVLPAPLLIYTIFTLQRLLCFNSAFA